MNDTQNTTTSTPGGPGGGADGNTDGNVDGEFDPQRLRSIADMRRSREDRMLGGVCSGAARYLNVDPIVVRVIVAVLTVVGLAGLILYLAAWLLVPAEDAEQSLAAEWFHLDHNEESVRKIGLVVAGVVALLSVIGDGGWGLWGHGWAATGWVFPWFLLPLAVLWFVFVVLPRRRRAAKSWPSEPAPADATATTTVLPSSVAAGPGAASPVSTGPASPTAAWEQWRPAPREPRSRTLVGLTFSCALIALAVTWIVDGYHSGVGWTAYVAVALGVVGAGLVVGTLFGHARPLIPVGILLCIALAFGSLLPSSRIGQQTLTPSTLADVATTYRQGIGQLELDLDGLADPADLEGRTITLKNGIGQTRVVVPSGVNVRVVSTLKAGEIDVFDRTADGTDNRLTYPAASDGAALTLRIHQGLGNIEVIRS